MSNSVQPTQSLQPNRKDKKYHPHSYGETEALTAKKWRDEQDAALSTILSSNLGNGK